MLVVLQIVMLSVTGFFVSYLAFLSLAALRGRGSDGFKAKINRRFAVVVPAYNEEESITDTIRSLSSVDYDPDRFRIIVIADNCTDRTAEIAEKEGALVMVRKSARERGKGYALRWCFDRLMASNTIYKFDAVVVVDADTIVSGNMLRVMNKYMEGGAGVVQGYLTVDSGPGAWTGEIIRIGFTLYNYVRPLARRRLGYSAGLRGNGMCFSMEVLEKVPWNAYSLTEDLEYSLRLLLNGVTVVFAPEAIGFSVVPEKADNAESQRERWEIGRYPVLKKYAGPLLKAAFRKRSVKIFDTLVDLVTPPLVNIMLLVLLMAGLSFLLWLTGVQQTPLYTILWLILFGLGIFHALMGLYVADAGWPVYRSLLHVPKYALWKVYVYFKVLLVKGRTTSWIRTSREVTGNE